MLSNKISALIDAAEFISDEQGVTELNLIKKTYDEGQYIVSFIGSFSAGKSYLLNNILGQSILPQGVLETTPFLTYIKYGEEEKAIIYYNNGTSKEIPVSDVACLTQKGIETKYHIADIEYLLIFLPLELLANGLVLLDTPGINTTISRHEQLLAESLAVSSRVFYVLNGMPRKNDIEKLKDLLKIGVPISVIRTHCDDIVDTEESLLDVIENDLKVLSNVDIKANNVYHISNLAQDKFPDFQRLKVFLANIAKDAYDNMKKDLKEKLNNTSEKYISILQLQLQELESRLNSEQEQYELKIAKKKCTIDDLEKTLSKLNDKVVVKSKEAENNLKAQLSLLVSTHLNEAKRCIESSNVCTVKEMNELLEKQKNTVLAKLLSDMYASTDPLISDFSNQLAEVENSCQFKLEGIDVNDISLAQIENDNRQELKGLHDKLALISREKEELAARLTVIQNSPELEVIKSDIDRLVEEIKNSDLANKELGEYEPQMIARAPEGLQPSQIGKVLGNVADFALMFIDFGATAPVKGAQAAKNSSKIVTSLAKVIGKIEKATKIISNSKSMADTVKRLKNMGKAYATAKRIKQAKKLITTTKMMKEAMPESMLDYLTLEYWGEQLGKNFDVPVVYTEDIEYKNEFNKAKHTIEQEITRQQMALIEKKRELGLFKNSQEENLAKQQCLTNIELKVQKELEKKEAEIAYKAKLQAISRWKSFCANNFIGVMEKHVQLLLSEYIETIPEKIEAFFGNKIENTKSLLEKERQEYIRLKDAPKENLLKEVKEIKTRIDDLRSA